MKKIEKLNGSIKKTDNLESVSRGGSNKLVWHTWIGGGKGDLITDGGATHWYQGTVSPTNDTGK